MELSQSWEERHTHNCTIDEQTYPWHTKGYLYQDIAYPYYQNNKEFWNDSKSLPCSHVGDPVNGEHARDTK